MLLLGQVFNLTMIRLIISLCIHANINDSLCNYTLCVLHFYCHDTINSTFTVSSKEVGLQKKLAACFLCGCEAFAAACVKIEIIKSSFWL